MIKLLVIKPGSEEREIIEVHESGSYFDESLVLWDERKDGPFPNNLKNKIQGLIRIEGVLTFSIEQESLSVSSKEAWIKRNYRALRRKEFEKRDLTFEKWAELEIDNDENGKAAFRSERQVVKDLYPKPL